MGKVLKFKHDSKAPNVKKSGRKSVLIVDDEYLNILMLSQILESEYIVYAEKDGKGALETAIEMKPDIILLDILMPEMDGFEVIAKLKNSIETRLIPVIFISGLSDYAAEEKGLALGAADYITKPFSSAVVKLRVRNQIKIVEQMQTIERLSLTDQLTNLPNRRSCDINFHVEWNRAHRDRAPISIMLMDVDRFKAYNDAFGHQQGDIALKELARSFKHILQRSSDFVGRWGGEEFVALLPNTNADGALEVAEKVRQFVEKMEIPSIEDAAAHITVSIGVNTREYGNTKAKIQDFFEGADKALYAAKSAGRNKVCHYSHVL